MSRRRRSRAPLPGPCIDCRPYDGRWRMVVIGEKEGFEPCDCARGKALRRLKRKFYVKSAVVDRRKQAAGDRS